MAVDPNVYALSIQLQLEAAEGFATLDKFGESVSKVEEQVSSAAQAALRSIDDVASGLDSSLGDITSSTQAIEINASGIEANFIRVVSALGDMSTLSSEGLDIGTEMVDILDEMVDLQEKLNKLGEDEFSNKEDLHNTGDNINQSIIAKNKLHDDELKKVKEEVSWSSLLGENFANMAKEVGKSVQAVSFLAKKFSDVMETISKATEMQEKFVTNNFRMYGSMDGMAAEVRSLGREYGVLETEALEAYTALANVRTPKDQIGAMTTNLVQMNRVTGVGMGTLAEYTKQLRGVGASAASTELHLNRMQDMMRKAGLSAEQMDKIMSNSSVSMQTLAVMFGDREGAEYFKETQVAAAGMANELGFSSEAISGHMDMMATDIGTLALQAQAAGMDIPKTAQETEKVMMAAGQAAAKEMAIIQASNSTMVEKQARYEALQESMGYANQASLEASAAIGREITRRQEAGEEIGNMTDMYADMQVEMAKAFDGTQRFTRSWEKLKLAVNGIFKEFLNLMGAIFGPMLVWLTRFANALATVIGWVNQLYDWLRQLWIIGDIIQFLESAAGFVMALAVVVGLLVVALTGFASVGALVSAAWGGAGTVISSIGQTMQRVAKAVGDAVVTVFRSIGEALAALGKAVRPQMVPLLALGAALLMAGLGAYFFAQGVMSMASLPVGEMAARLFILVAAMLTMALGLALISMIVGPVIPLMLALGLALLLIGAAAWLMGAGLMMAAEAFVMIHDAIGPHSPAMWVALPMVALGILMLAAAALFGAPGIIALGIALFFVAIAARILAPAFIAIVKSMEGMDAEMVVNVGVAMVTGAALFLAAAAIMLVAGALLIPAAALLVAAMATLIIAAPMTIPVGAQLIAGGALMLIGSVLMLAAAILLFPASVLIALSAALIFIGAALLLVGLPMIGAAAAMMLVVGPALIAGAVLFAVGSAFLGGAAAKIYKNGMLVGKGGEALLAGTRAVLTASSLIGSAGGALKTAVKQLGVAIEGLDMDQIKKLRTIGSMLYSAGIYLLIGSIGLYIGAIFLVAASSILIAGAEQVTLAAELMLPASIVFIEVGLNFLIAGQMLFEGAWLLLLASWVLSAAVFSLTLLVPLLISTGFMLIFGATLVYIAAWILHIAADTIILASLMMILGAQLIMIGSEMLYQAGISLSISGLRLGLGSMTMLWASWILLEATMVLMFAGYFLVPAALAIYTGLWWLVTSIDRFKKSIPTIEKVSAAMFQLATAFNIMRTVPFNTLDDAAEAGLSALPKLDKFATQLPSVADRMRDATARFKKPASELAQVLHTLGDAITKFDGVGQNLAAEMEAVSNTLDKYAHSLEEASERIQIAVNAKAIPAMKAADNSGVTDVVKSESIAQVQVTTNTEGSEKSKDEQTELLMAQVVALNDLNDKVDALTGANGAGEVGEILAIITAYLPEMAGKRGGLSSEMNSWTK